MVGEEGGLLRLPQRAQYLLRKMADVEGTLSQTLGRTPTLAEVAAEVRQFPEVPSSWRTMFSSSRCNILCLSYAKFWENVFPYLRNIIIYYLTFL